MTPEHQQIVIAESLGWKRVSVFSWSNGNRDPKQWLSVSDLPNYLNSRDAMAEALAGLTKLEQGRFCVELLWICNTKTSRAENAEVWSTVTATPSQLAEAYIRTKGLWEE